MKINYPWGRHAAFLLTPLFFALTSCVSGSLFSNKKPVRPQTMVIYKKPASSVSIKPEPKAELEVIKADVKVEAEAGTAVRRKKVSTVLSTAHTYKGTPHKMGGLSKRGIDCSGLMYVSFQKVNLSLPRSSHEMAKVGAPVKAIKDLEVGDLLFFSRKGTSRITHVGMVSQLVGDKDIRFIHTSTSRGVREDNLFSEYWRKNFVKATRPL